MKTPEELGRELAAKTHLGFDREVRELAAAIIAEAVKERDAEWEAMLSACLNPLEEQRNAEGNHRGRAGENFSAT